MRYLTVLFLSIFSFSLPAQTTNFLSTQTAKLLLNQSFASMEQSFEVLPDYLGNPQLLTNLLLNLENSSQKIVIYRSFDGKNWEKVSEVDLENLNRSSYQNLPLQMGLEDLEQLIQKINHRVYLKTTLIAKDSHYDFPQIAQFSKQDLKKFRKSGQTQVLALK